MPRSSSSFLFPDINVWLALSSERHVHYSLARRWFERQRDDVRLCFCRFTQLGLLRLLTTEAVMMEEVLTQAQAWRAYDSWLDDDRILFLEEPATIEPRFRALTQLKQPAAKDWSDSYLSAFAATAGLRLVTFDQSLHKKSSNTELLG